MTDSTSVVRVIVKYMGPCCHDNNSDGSSFDDDTHNHTIFISQTSPVAMDDFVSFETDGAHRKGDGDGDEYISVIHVMERI